MRDLQAAFRARRDLARGDFYKGLNYGEFALAYYRAFNASMTVQWVKAWEGGWLVGVQETLLAGEFVCVYGPFFDETNEMMSRETRAEWEAAQPQEGENESYTRDLEREAQYLEG